MTTKDEKKYWFPAKPPGYGWGWGLPITWQGWVVFGSYFVLLIAGAVGLVQDRAELFAAYTFGLSALLVLICWMKGEPPGNPFR